MSKKVTVFLDPYKNGGGAPRQRHPTVSAYPNPPTEAEINSSAEFIQNEGLSQFTRAMLNANEFVFIP